MVMLYNSDNPTETSEKMCQVLENNDRSTGNLYNYAREIQDVRAMMLVIKIFSYGFIILISLISIANVFNTISTNILLRRREFAVLRSVGMYFVWLQRIILWPDCLRGSNVPDLSFTQNSDDSRFLHSVVQCCDCRVQCVLCCVLHDALRYEKDSER